MIKRNLGWAPLMIMAMLISLMSCEQEDRFVGSNVVGEGSAQLHKAYVDLVATTLMPDSIRADRAVLQNATIGVFDEPLLGKTKSYYYSQVRLGTTNPDFGNNPIVDSVVLNIPVFAQTTDTLATEHYIDRISYSLNNPEDDDCTVRDTLTYYNTRFKFALDSIYGNPNANMTLQVHRVMDDLKTIDSAKYSNEAPQIGELFGSQVITGEAWRSYISQFSSLDSGVDSTIVSQDTRPTLRIKLEGMKSFVQQNIVDESGSTNLGDQISFINNVLKGIRIGVADENGFILTFDPLSINLKAYISSDNPDFVDENGNGVHDTEEDCPVSIIEPRVTNSLGFIIGSSLSQQSGTQYYNVAHNHIINENGSVPYNQEDASVNFVEGMGGAKIKIALDPVQLNAIKDSVRSNNWVISEAHFKLYPDMNTQGDLPLPEYLYAFNLTEKKLLPDYGDPDDPELQAFPYLQISRPYSENGYYLLRVTEFIKNIVEDNAPVDDLAIEMGSYLGFNETYYFYAPRNAYFSNRAFNPYRLAVVGANPAADQMDKKLQLEIFYNKREN